MFRSDHRWGAQSELARRLGTSTQMLYMYKSGKSGLSIKQAQRWAEVLGVDFIRLLTAPARDRPKLLGLDK